MAMKKLGLVFVAVIFGVMLVTGAYAEPKGEFIKGRYVTAVKELPLFGFVTNDSGYSGGPIAPLTTSTVPGLEYDDYMWGVVWADNETTPIEQTFEVPSDYYGDGEFRVWFTRSGTDVPPMVDYTLWINTNKSTAASTVTNYQAVALDPSYISSPQQVTLPITDTLTAGQLVTLQIWRDGSKNASTDDLELKGNVLFVYERVK